MENVIVLENIRSAYNTGNIIRTADALSRGVILSGFTPSPQKEKRVEKTSLGAENHIHIEQCRNTKETINLLKARGYICIAAETTPNAIPVHTLLATYPGIAKTSLALIVGNERTGVLQETLEMMDYIVVIPMNGYKESLNVGQAAAICMRELRK